MSGLDPRVDPRRDEDELTAFDITNVMPDVSRAIRSRDFSQARVLLMSVMTSEMAEGAMLALISTEPLEPRPKRLPRES